MSDEGSIDISTFRFDSAYLDRYGAPKLSKLTECNAPPLEYQSRYFISYIVNSMLVKHKDPVHRMILMFGRRVQQAVREYRRGRHLLLGYVDKLPQTNVHLIMALNAIASFEQCIALACQAAALLGRIEAYPKHTLIMEPLENRLKKIWNRSKHFDEDLLDIKVAPAEITAPVWLTNKGIESKVAAVTFRELHAALEGLVSALKFFGEDLPNQALERAAAK
jgi:hypothetical protein